MSSFQTPTRADAESVLVRIPTYQLRRVFYEGLKNPRWVRPLYEVGAFRNPPEPEETSDGYVRDTYWPEISFLTRVAQEAPADVVDVLLTLENSNNAWVRRATFEIGSNIPAAEGARLKPLLQAWATTARGFGWRTDPRDQVSFAIRLLEGKETKTGRWLANKLFGPKPAIADNPFLRKPVLAMDEHWYQKELPRLLPALGEDAFKAVVGWLVDFAKFSGPAAGEHDFSGIMRPSIRAHDGSFPSPENALIDAVRDLAIPGVLDAPEATVHVLLRSGVQLLRKITMFAVAEAIRSCVGAGADARYLLGVAEGLLGDKASDNEHLRVEYADLAQAVATVDSSSLDVINKFIAFAHAEDLRWMHERLVDPGNSEKATEVQIQERADRNKHRWLSAIGANALPPQLRTELAELGARYGRVEDALTPSGAVTSWTGPNPYSTQDEMAAMSPTELVAHLGSWHDTGDGWGPAPSHEGQGRELAGLLATNPRATDGVPNLAEKLRPTYLRAILRGWEAALKADLELEWRQVAELVRDVLAHEDKSPFPVEGRKLDDDENLRGAKRAAVGLLEELVRKRQDLTIPPNSLSQFAELLIEDADDEEAWVEYDTYDPGESNWDPLTMSLNWQWPTRLRALITLATRADRAPWSDKAMAAIERELSRDDKHGAGRAVLGENTGRLLASAPEWLHHHCEEFFGSEIGVTIQQQIALTTTLATHYYHHALYDLLSRPMIAAIGVGDSIASGWPSHSPPLQRMGEWVIDARLYGHKTADDPVAQAFFTTASPKSRGGALGAIAWSFSRASTVEVEIRDRFASLWDERIHHVKEHPEDHEELTGFYWMAKSDLFPAQWWLPRLKEALELEPGVAEERYMIGKELARASTSDPEKALAVLRLLLGGRDQSGLISHDLSRNAVPVVIANAMEAGDAALKWAAERYMNDLGAKGYLQLESEVRAVLNGRLTTEDVDD
ncbi:MAG: hypothetical protein EOL91_01805 [Actinobacteria bacterium]|nr:hypothetical protein [Actinomycetota bacterium]